MKTLFAFIKNETVLIISCILAILSSCFVPPNPTYLDYIDFRTLALLFCLMAVMAGCNRLGVFHFMASKLLRTASTDRGLSLTLVTLCFFSAMIITNDVALITFIPFTIFTLKMINKMHLLLYLVTLETVAANLGSMLTPIGNPQNLYLFSAFHMGVSDFFLTILPFALISYLLLAGCCLFIKRNAIPITEKSQLPGMNRKLLFLYALLFVASLCSVFRLLDCYLLLGIIIFLLLVFDRITLFEIDYSLLLTFVFLFIFVGNLGNMEQIRLFFENTVRGNEVLSSILASQVLSNVPTAILFSGFTENVSALLIGVNLGGLGTLIASMASLISFKFIQKTEENTLKYIFIFTSINVIFLFILYLLYLAIR